MIKLCIVEGNEEIRNSWKQLFALSESIECVHLFTSGESFIQQHKQLDIDVVLMDIALPDINGIECIKAVKLRNPNVQFLICTAQEDDDTFFNSIRAGATGYLLKSTTFEEIEKAVADIYSGGSPMTGRMVRKVVNTLSERPNNEIATKLTSREKQILNMLSQGHRYKEIAAKLNLSVETVRTHIRNIYGKLQVNNRMDALNVAFLNKKKG